jgi:hypothetical protein
MDNRKSLYFVKPLTNLEQQIRKKALQPKSFTSKQSFKFLDEFMNRNYHEFLRKKKDREDQIFSYSETEFVPKISEQSRKFTENRENDPPGEIYKNLYKEAYHHKGKIIN